MAIHFLNDNSKALFEDTKKLLFRVMPLDRVMEILKTNKWAFVSPTLWNDPFEKAFLEAEYNHDGEKFFLPVKPREVSEKLSYILFSVCLTETRESEAFWKTYSPNGDGIRLTLNAVELKASLSEIEEYDVYIGKAVYEDYEKLYGFQQDLDYWNSLKSKSINDEHFKLLLKKRSPFEYENEVRIFLLRKNPISESVAKVTLKNPEHLIRGIKLDPRMGEHMANMVKEAFVSKGFSPDIIRISRLYSKPDTTITFKKDIDMPPSNVPTHEI